MQAVRRQNTLTFIFLSLFTVAVILWYLNNLVSKELGYIQTVLYIGLLIAWCYTVKIRVLQAGVRRWITVICGLLILWFVLRALKYYVVPGGTNLNRHLWYLYYIAILFIPVCAVTAVAYIGKSDQWRVPKKHFLSYGISAIFLLLVLINDEHELIFQFPDNEPIRSDVHYRYGRLYYVIYVWYMICILVTLFTVIRRSRLPGKSKIFLGPIIPQALLIVYNLLYAIGRASFFSDITVVVGFLTVLSFEIAIRVGLIRANTHYMDIFLRSSLSVQLLDEHLHVVASACGEVEVPDEYAFQTAINGDFVPLGDHRLGVSPIAGGYVAWQEDVSDLMNLREQLKYANEYLEGKNTALNQKYNTAMKRRRLEEQNRLYNKMQNETAERLNKLVEYIELFEHSAGTKERDALLQISIISTYIKRRNNLLLLSEEDDDMSPSELYNCINETANNLEVFGIPCKMRFAMTGRLSFQGTVYLYDMLEEIVEKTARRGAAYFIMVTQEGGLVALGVRGIGLQSPSFKSVHGFKIHGFQINGIQIEKEENEEDEEYYIRITFNTNSNDADGKLHRNGGV